MNVMEEKVNILLVDDNDSNLDTLKAVLDDPDYNLVRATSGREALKRILEFRDFAVILLDVQMPEMDGFETARLIMKRKSSRATPIIFLTAISKEESYVFKGYAAGAVDYIVKPFEPLILKAKVAFFVQFYRKDQQLQKANRELTAVQLRLQEANEILQNLNANLEQQVCKRTADLQAKNEELNTVLQQLWQAAKLATMGELASSIAHELNNPLATVSLRIESLTAQTPEGDKRLRELEIIGQEVGRMGNLVTNLLQFSRRSQKQISTVDIREEIEKTFELIEYHFRKNNIQVIREFAPDVPGILADRQQLRQLFLNLFTNASDAMPKGGTLTIRVAAQPEEKKIFIEIADTGTGIPPEILPKVMEPFYTTKPEGKGTGLGLAICRRIAQEHRGTFDITSEGIPGKGTKVSITLSSIDDGNSIGLMEP